MKRYLILLVTPLLVPLVAHAVMTPTYSVGNYGDGSYDVTVAADPGVDIALVNNADQSVFMQATADSSGHYLFHFTVTEYLQLLICDKTNDVCAVGGWYGFSPAPQPTPPPAPLPQAQYGTFEWKLSLVLALFLAGVIIMQFRFRRTK